MKHPATSAALAALITLALPAQEASSPAPEQAATDRRTSVRLVYELPVDVLQRTLRDRPSMDLEQLLAAAVASARSRVGRVGTVERHEATGFAVTLRDRTAAEIADCRDVVETIGSFEMRLVANADSTPELRAERARLGAWLDAGGRERVLADPRAVEAYEPSDRARVRWVPRRITREGDRWAYTMQLIPEFQDAVVQLFDAREWNDGSVAEGAPQQLVELVALDLDGGGFDNHDLDAKTVQVRKGRGGRAGIVYALLPARMAEYADWTGANVGRAAAVVVNGELLSAPILRSRIPGRGIVEGLFDDAEALTYSRALRAGPLPAAPKLVRTEPIER